MNRTEGTAYRGSVIDSIERHLFGPAEGDHETVVGKPYWRYLSGMLFPSQLQQASVGDHVEEPNDDAGASDDGVEDPAVAAAYDALPSSMGITFFVQAAAAFDFSIEAGRYERDSSASARELWKRVPVATREEPEHVRVQIPAVGEGKVTEQKPVLDGRASLHVMFRRYGPGLLVTATLMNALSASGSSPQRQVEEMLFQCRFHVDVLDGYVSEYPARRRFSMHDEDEELAYAYRSRKPYGIGHGCAAAWSNTTTHVARISAEPLPRVEVKGLTNQIELSAQAERTLDLAWLADESVPADDLARALNTFVDEYEAWHRDQARHARDADAAYQLTCERIVRRQKRAIERMRKGIDVLSNRTDSALVLRAFRIAQRAMYTQFSWGRRVNGRAFDVGDSPIPPTSVGAGEDGDSVRWRAFQLAYQLLVLESLADHGSDERNTLDLLWFPTGGGKTEAYLALAAFEIALRRLRHGDAGAGTAVMMRYTLRLLTNQQFERCATMVSAMESLRRRYPDLGLGDVAIGLGLWVGSDTPNRLSGGPDGQAGAVDLFEDLREADEPDNPFKLLNCPACGTRIVPQRKSTRRGDYGVEVTASSFAMWCPDERCELHDGIPVSVVDEDLYYRPPSLLIGTIDKFARMVWEPRSRALLGLGYVTTDDGETSSVLPPSLVIQDELHLINGPLGTIAGMYEAAIDTVVSRQGVNVKYLAATATIQRATEQCRALYARSASLFPPPGLDARDSFYTREDENAPGRMFVGAMNTGVYTSLTTLVQASASSAQAVQELAARAETRDDALAVDSYWTQVIYHNSRQELGKTTTLLRDDVVTRLRALAPDAAVRRFDRVVELSGNLQSGVQISQALEELKVAWPDEMAIDVLACTNMISVGIDVERLGLMIVKGQPKTTAEYIQATSRVGREMRRPPGIVVTLYTATRPRDRSHFEAFQQYHSALYRAVEPSTVTPFALPAIERTLHAAVVLAVRHVAGLVKPEQASEFTLDDPDTRATLQHLKQRIQLACPQDQWDLVATRFDRVVEAWAEAADDEVGLRFDPIRQFPHLLERAPSAHWSVVPPWPTLNSMRHVDGEAPIKPVTGWAR